MGARTLGSGEGGYRFRAGPGLSPYLGLRLASEQQLLAHPGRAFSDFENYNNVDGVAGLLARGGSRLNSSHAVHDHTAITRFIEALFDLPALTARDANSDALFELFDFSCGRDLSVPEAPAVGSGGCPRRQAGE